MPGNGPCWGPLLLITGGCQASLAALSAQNHTASSLHKYTTQVAENQVASTACLWRGLNVIVLDRADGPPLEFQGY